MRESACGCTHTSRLCVAMLVDTCVIAARGATQTNVSGQVTIRFLRSLCTHSIALPMQSLAASSTTRTDIAHGLSPLPHSLSLASLTASRLSYSRASPRQGPTSSSEVSLLLGAFPGTVAVPFDLSKVELHQRQQQQQPLAIVEQELQQALPAGEDARTCVCAP